MSVGRTTAKPPVAPAIAKAPVEKKPLAPPPPAAPAPKAGWTAGAKAGAAAAAVKQRPTSNDYKTEFKGVPTAQGTFVQQAKQGAYSADMAISAGLSVASGSRLPADRTIKAQLSALSPTPPIAGKPTAEAKYTSTVPGAAPSKVFQEFVDHPAAVFGAAGLTIRPPIDKLTDGARVQLQDKGPPPVWLPIEVKLDPKNNKISITTLDGHAFRGTNNFSFQADGKGGTKITQESKFQGSSPLIEVGKQLGAIDKQHAAWKSVHQHFFNATRGD